MVTAIFTILFIVNVIGFIWIEINLDEELPHELIIEIWEYKNCIGKTMIIIISILMSLGILLIYVLFLIRILCCLIWHLGDKKNK